MKGGDEVDATLVVGLEPGVAEHGSITTQDTSDKRWLEAGGDASRVDEVQGQPGRRCERQPSAGDGLQTVREVDRGIVLSRVGGLRRTHGDPEAGDKE
jgi:hypothetical protein